MPAQKQLNARSSRRSPASTPANPEDYSKQKIIDLLQPPNKGPFGHKVRFALIDFSEINKNDIGSLGTYGFISGAKSFIVSAIKDAEETSAMERHLSM
jgi:hypothetical protein